MVAHFVNLLRFRFEYVLAKGGRREPVWQPDYREQTLPVEQIVSTAAFILENPVRNGLVDNFVDYPHSFLLPDFRNLASDLPLQTLISITHPFIRHCKPCPPQSSTPFFVIARPDQREGHGNLAPVIASPDFHNALYSSLRTNEVSVAISYLSLQALISITHHSIRHCEP